MKFLFAIFLFTISGLKAQTIDVTAFGVQPNSFVDATVGMQKAIEACRNQNTSVISFPLEAAKAKRFRGYKHN